MVFATKIIPTIKILLESPVPSDCIGQQVNQCTTPYREVLFGIDPTSSAIFYTMAFVVLGFVLLSIIRIFRIWTAGQRPYSVKEMIKLFIHNLKYPIKDGLFQGRIYRRDTYAGVMHTFILSGMLAEFIATAIMTVHERHDLFGIPPFLFGNVYLIYSFLADFFGVLLIIGAFMAFYRRYIIHHPRAVNNDFYDWFILLGLALVGFQGFFTEALRILYTDFPSFEIWSFGGWIFALMLQPLNLSPQTILDIHFYSWWFHAFTAEIGIAIVFYTKLGHLFYAPINMFFKEDKVIGKVTVDPEHPIKTVKEFRLNQLVSLEACMKCARCHVNCPAQASGEPLSPMMVIQDSKAAVRQDFPLLSFYKSKKEYTTIPGGPKVTADVLWACTNCMACVDNCPVHIHHVDIITSMRGSLVEEGKTVPQPITAMLESVYQNKNEYGQPKKERTKWAEDLPFEVPEQKKNNAELLWWVGSTSSYDPRNQKVAKSFAKILNAVGVEYGTLGAKEGNTGDAVRRVGEEALFRELAESNIKAFKKAGIKRIVTTSPHSFNAIKNEYPELGFDNSEIEVIHHTQFLWELIQQGKIKFEKEIKRSITFHDACYIGRYNGIIDTPRNILKSIPGIELTEMPRNGRESFCCGGGGGRAFMPSHTEIKPSEIRVQEAKTTLQNSDSTNKSIIVECHWCVQMLTDATKTQNVDQEIAVEEIAELVAEAMGLD